MATELRMVSPDFQKREMAALNVLLDGPLAVVTFAGLEAVDHSMTSPAPIEAPVQRRGLYEHDSVRSIS